MGVGHGPGHAGSARDHFSRWRNSRGTAVHMDATASSVALRQERGRAIVMVRRTVLGGDGPDDGRHADEEPRAGGDRPACRQRRLLRTARSTRFSHVSVKLQPDVRIVVEKRGHGRRLVGAQIVRGLRSPGSCAGPSSRHSPCRTGSSPPCGDEACCGVFPRIRGAGRGPAGAAHAIPAIEGLNTRSSPCRKGGFQTARILLTPLGAGYEILLVGVDSGPAHGVNSDAKVRTLSGDAAEIDA